jgi:RHS repeat-associated protein
VNGVASNAAGHLPKRALGYGTAKGSDIVGQKRYELSNHLNNVLEVISDRKWATDNGQYNLTTGAQTSSTPDGLADYYLPVIVAYTDYDPYGTAQTGRKGGDPTYRYGFQGQEMDDEIKGEGNSVNYEYRMHDPRLGRFFAVDPLAPKYPHNSPYAFSENVVINAVELEGLERKYSFNSAIAAENFNSKLKAYNAGTISYEQLTSYLNAHSISYMHESAREYVRKQLAKGKTKEAVWVNNRDSGVRYISHDGGSTAGWIIVNTIVKNEDGSYDRKAISIGNPDAPVAKGSAFPTGMAIGGHWWEDGQGPFTKVELKLTTYTLTVGGHKYESGFTLKESGLDGGTDVFTFHKTLLTTDYSKVPKVGGPSLTLDFYLSDGDKTKPNIALKASGQSRILKVGTSINTNGENKFSVGVALPKANDKVSVSLEYELKKTETKVNF